MSENKKKLISAIYILALFASFAVTVSLIFNTFDSLFVSTFGTATYKRVQLPLAFIMLIASGVSVTGLVFGLIRLFTENERKKQVCFYILIGCAAAMLLFVIVSNAVAYSYILKNTTIQLPIDVNMSSRIYVYNTTVNTMLFQQLAYFAVAFVMCIIENKSFGASKSARLETKDESV